MDCHRDVRNRNDLLRQAIEQAKQYAVANKVNAVVYEETPNFFKYMAEAPAKETGVIPLYLVSHLQPAHAG